MTRFLFTWGVFWAATAFLLAVPNAQAQLGGRYPFSFLGVPTSARAAALGGLLPQNAKEDAASLLYNPAGASTKGQASLSYNPYAGRFNYSSLAAMMDKWGATVGFGMQYLNYGTLNGYTAGGDPTGSYTANAYALSLNYSKALGPFRYGVNFKVAGSNLESYNAFGIGADLGMSYKHAKADFAAGFVIQNIGGVVKTYQNITQRSWPTQLSAGASYKPEHMPVRFFVTAQQLQQWDISYLDPGYNVRVDATGQEVPEKKTFTDKLFRHAAIGAELNLGKSVRVRGGYNHLVRSEMRIENGSSGAAGYSTGIGINYQEFVFDYTHQFISTASGANYIALSYNFGQRLEDYRQEKLALSAL